MRRSVFPLKTNIWLQFKERILSKHVLEINPPPVQKLSSEVPLMGAAIVSEWPWLSCHKEFSINSCHSTIYHPWMQLLTYSWPTVHFSRTMYQHLRLLSIFVPTRKWILGLKLSFKRPTECFFSRFFRAHLLVLGEKQPAWFDALFVNIYGMISNGRALLEYICVNA